MGHLHAGCAKDITVTLKSDVAVTFKMHPVKCKVARISFQLPPEQVTDWDDRLHTVKWVDATRSPGAMWPVKKKVRGPIATANQASAERAANGSRTASPLAEQLLLAAGVEPICGLGQPVLNGSSRFVITQLMVLKPSSGSIPCHQQGVKPTALRLLVCSGEPQQRSSVCAGDPSGTLWVSSELRLHRPWRLWCGLCIMWGISLRSSPGAV